MPRRDYALPDAEFTPIPNLDIDVGQPITSFLMGELRDGAYHSRDVCYDPELHVPVLAHDHDGRNSAHLISAPQMPNLLSTGTVWESGSFDAGGAESGRRWIFHATSAGPYGLPFSSGNQWASLCLMDVDRPSASLSVFGAYCDVVVSCYLKATAPGLSAGVLSMGLIGAPLDPEEAQPDFPEGMRVYIPATIVETEWVRVWAVLDNVASDWAGESVRFAIRCDEGVDGGEILANGFDVRPGRSLDYYCHGYVSAPYDGWVGYGHPGLPPYLDTTVSITDAIKLGAS